MGIAEEDVDLQLRTSHFREQAANDIQQARPRSVYSTYEVVKRRADFIRAYSDVRDSGQGVVSGSQRGGEPTGSASRANRAAQALEDLPKGQDSAALAPRSAAWQRRAMPWPCLRILPPRRQADKEVCLGRWLPHRAGLVLQHRQHMAVEAAQVLFEAPQHEGVVGT